MKLFVIQFGLAVVCFLAISFLSSTLTYMIGIPVILLSAWYSFKELDKRLHLKELLNNYLNKK